MFIVAMQFVTGEPVIDASCRTNIGGYHVTDYLKQLLSLEYPNHMYVRCGLDFLTRT